MREWRGFEVPVEPKKEWKKWMCGGTCTFCSVQSCVGKGVCKSVIFCRTCIYSSCNGAERKEFYNECFPEKPKKLPQRDAKGRFRKKGGTEMMYYWEGLKVPVDLKREWGEWMCSENICPGNPADIKCGYGKTVTCSECVYSRHNSEARRRFYEKYYGKWPTSGKSEYPKLTVEVFNRPDCPEWACFAAVDKNGEAHFYSRKPLSDSVYSCWYIAWCTDRDNLLRIESDRRAVHFDASDWKHSLIQRPVKELPKLTQTSFHSPDCPKEAAKLKVFPANHVVALDKDDKVLSVMELQCKEGEVSRVRADWYYNKKVDILYYGKDFEYTEPPVGADPVKVSYLPSDVLKGTAVRKAGVAGDFLILDVNGSLVTLVGVNGKEFISMVTLILEYRITCSGDRCCVIRPLQ